MIFNPGMTIERYFMQMTINSSRYLTLPSSGEILLTVPNERYVVVLGDKGPRVYGAGGGWTCCGCIKHFKTQPTAEAHLDKCAVSTHR